MSARPRPVIVWFRSDLRLDDHPALSAAIKAGAPVIPLYILDDGIGGRWKRGAASRWWLAKSFEALASDICQRGGRLILRRGETISELRHVADEADASAIYFTREYEPATIALENQLNVSFSGGEILLKRYGGTLLREPEDLRTSSGGSYQVFTPFWRAFQSDLTVARAIAAPEKLEAPACSLASDDIADWALLPVKPDWSGGLAGAWQPGARGAQDQLKTFVDDALNIYAKDRDRLDHFGTSRLSPHLAFGEISPAACWRAATSALREAGASERSTETFLKEIIWREFCYSLLFHFPDMPDEPLRKEFATLEWSKKSSDLKAWQTGKTGYPIVDAGMRELWATGYMHNRARMITASFLTKHLLLPWQLGEAWFWDTLVDADLANNSANWQWVAGCGADAAPYFRIFNPVLQGQKFDPDGDYVRRWVPELAGLPAPFIHAPWTADGPALKRASVVIGKSHPAPIVDHKAARSRALEAFEKLKRV